MVEGQRTNKLGLKIKEMVQTSTPAISDIEVLGVPAEITPEDRNEKVILTSYPRSGNTLLRS